MLNLDDRREPATAETPTTPASGGEALLALASVVGYVAWIFVWLFVLRDPFNRWVAQYTNSYPLLLPIVVFPAAVVFACHALYKRRLKLLGQVIGFALLLTLLLGGAGLLARACGVSGVR